MKSGTGHVVFGLPNLGGWLVYVDSTWHCFINRGNYIVSQWCTLAPTSSPRPPTSISWHAHTAPQNWFNLYSPTSLRMLSTSRKLIFFATSLCMLSKSRKLIFLWRPAFACSLHLVNISWTTSLRNSHALYVPKVIFLWRPAFACSLLYIPEVNISLMTSLCMLSKSRMLIFLLRPAFACALQSGVNLSLTTSLRMLSTSRKRSILVTTGILECRSLYQRLLPPILFSPPPPPAPPVKNDIWWGVVDLLENCHTPDCLCNGPHNGLLAGDVALWRVKFRKIREKRVICLFFGCTEKVEDEEKSRIAIDDL